ncbi:MAG: demethoxyubiquinone hydroxylase family protein [Candidatus Symbiobacter sp.]|nr:demethoxyubiquinone hydroxylase family protein [Candidatus Symbiobacter sp.]
MTDNYHPSLPGDLSGKKLLDRVIRVDHAGEYGAKRIYAGQLAVLAAQKRRGHKINEENYRNIAHMAAQEEQHLKKFSELIGQRRARPTVLLPIWHVAGFALGAATAMLGERAAMACTIAVEEVIDAHYARQEAILPPSEAELKANIAQFRAEELEHRDTAIAAGGRETPFYQALAQAVKLTSRAAIFLSERV